MTRTRLALALLAVTLAAVPCSAEVFIVTLNNGSAFHSRYQPTEAAWDSSKIVFVDELGIQVALLKSDVESVTSETETSGFGTVIDSTTIDLGFLPNDMPSEEEAQAGDARTVIQRMLDQQQLYQTPSYDQNQFVEPDSVGGGIPVGAIQSQPSVNVIGLPPGGGGQ
jgi:hypothetical protein